MRAVLVVAQLMQHHLQHVLVRLEAAARAAHLDAHHLAPVGVVARCANGNTTNAQASKACQRQQRRAKTRAHKRASRAVLRLKLAQHGDAPLAALHYRLHLPGRLAQQLERLRLAVRAARAQRLKGLHAEGGGGVVHGRRRHPKVGKACGAL